MAKGRIPGIPIIYDSRKAEKVIVDSRDDKSQVESQLNGYNSKVGFATNISSSMYAMLEEFPEGTPERAAILKRLKIGRVIQGEIIDSVKGLKVPPFREHWTEFRKITDKMTPEEAELQTFYNKIACEIRPAFFRFLYPHYMSRYNKEIKKYNIYSLIQFGMRYEEILKLEERTPEQEKLVSDHKRYSFFLDNNSVVNRISRYMRANLGLVSKYSTHSSQQFDYTLLKNKDLPENAYGRIQMQTLLREYKSFKRGMYIDPVNAYDNLDSFIAHLRDRAFSTISSNEAELANYAIEVTYGGEVSMTEFCWKMFPDGILQNLIANSNGTIKFPVRDPEGEIEYLWSRYTMKEFSLEELYENK